jgi:phosphate transport system protein
MERTFVKHIGSIRATVIEMGTLVEEAVSRATASFLERSVDKARQVVEGDGRINALEIAIDKAVFEFLALHQPVAGDLRFIFIVQKMNKDLERLGDHAVNIAQATMSCATIERPMPVGQVPTMSSMARQMLRDSLTSFIDGDPQLALTVLEQDDQVDAINRSMTRETIEMVKKGVAGIEAALELIKVVKNLERIADLATNIAEDVIFYTQARDVKHHGNAAAPAA